MSNIDLLTRKNVLQSTTERHILLCLKHLLWEGEPNLLFITQNTIRDSLDR
jgi:hypothetical protein